jgi:hypothetical protein
MLPLCLSKFSGIYIPRRGSRSLSIAICSDEFYPAAMSHSPAGVAAQDSLNCFFESPVKSSSSAQNVSRVARVLHKVWCP